MSRGLDHTIDGRHQALPACDFSFDLFLSARREFVELRLAIVGGSAPLGRDHSLGFQPMERGIERAFLHAKDILAELLNVLGDAEAVHRSSGEAGKDQHVERTLDQFAFRWPSHRFLI